MKKFFTKEIVIGIAVIASLALLFWGINYLKGINIITPANCYYVKYSQINGLKVSAPVTINGYQVGLVREITYDYNDNGKIVAKLSLDKELKLPVGTKAMVVSDMLGTSTVVLQLSNSHEFYPQESELEGTLEPGLMDDVSKQLLPSVAMLIPKIDSILTNLNTIMANPALNKSVTRLDNITANLEQSTIQLNQILGKSVPSILNNAQDVSADLKHISTNLAQVSDEIKKMPLDSTMRNLNSTTANLKKITDKVNSKDSNIGLLLNDRKLYDNANKTVVSLDSLLNDLRWHPKRYVTFKVF